jgi:ankyrin repeat protein
MNLNQNAKLIYLNQYYGWKDLTNKNVKWLLESNKFLNEQLDFTMDEKTHFSTILSSNHTNLMQYNHIVENYLDKTIKENFQLKDQAIFNQLVKIGFNVNQIFEESIYYGENAIFTHLKSKAYCSEYIKFLISNNFDINNQDSSGKTLLHHAVFNKAHPIMIKVLMMFGANPYIKDDANLDIFDYIKIFNVENIYQNALSYEEDYNFEFTHLVNAQEFKFELQKGIENHHLSFNIQSFFQDQTMFDLFMTSLKEKDKNTEETLLMQYLLLPKEIEKRKVLNNIFLNIRNFALNEDGENFIISVKDNLNIALSYNDEIINNFIIKENIFQKITQDKNAYSILNEKDEYSSTPLFKIISSKNKDLIQSFFNLDSKLINFNQKTNNGATIAKKLLYCLQDEAIYYYEKFPQLLNVVDNDGSNLLSHTMKQSKYHIAKKLLSIDISTFNQKDDYGFQAKDYIDLIASKYFINDGWREQDIEIDAKMYADFQLVKDKLRIDFENFYLFLNTKANDKSKNKIIKV